MAKVPEIFGSMVFNDQKMQERLPKSTYKALKKTIQNGEPLDLSVANVVAAAMKDWAVEMGCTHYTHWFQPMTGITAEKHDSFIFPSGGLRATFEARGYTTWDPTSYAFVKDGTLYIPTAFCSYTGEVLDKKTPLLRSMERINTEAVKILHLLGKENVTRVTTTVGPEQEYFLIDKDAYDQREDLIYTGRTLFGAKAPKGQELDDHYFGAIKTRVAAYMKDLDEELWKLGILAKTKHNEVAPSQHELAPIFTTTNIATDHNELTMEVMKKEYVSKGKQKMRTGVDVLPDFMKDTSDRNRTSPFAFTGNKFEFRALGSSLNIACPNYMLNTMVAEELSEFYDELKDADDMDAAIKALVKKVFTEHQNIIFNGNNYAPEWVEEAERRGLLNLKSLPDAMEHFLDKKNIDLFVKNKICSADEIRARYEIELESYSKQINIEALTMIDMAKKNILPAVTSYVRDLTDTALAKKALSDAIPTSVEEDLITSLSNKLVCFSKKTAELEEAVIKSSDYSDDNLKYAKYYRETVFALMQELRAVGDAMETETASEYWPYPSYGELLFGV